MGGLQKSVIERIANATHDIQTRYTFNKGKEQLFWENFTACRQNLTWSRKRFLLMIFFFTSLPFGGGAIVSQNLFSLSIRGTCRKHAKGDADKIKKKKRLSTRQFRIGQHRHTRKGENVSKASILKREGIIREENQDLTTYCDNRIIFIGRNKTRLQLNGGSK